MNVFIYTMNLSYNVSYSNTNLPYILSQSYIYLVPFQYKDLGSTWLNAFDRN